MTDPTPFKLVCNLSGDETFADTVEDMPRGALMLLDDAFETQRYHSKALRVTFFVHGKPVATVDRNTVLKTLAKEA